MNSTKRLALILAVVIAILAISAMGSLAFFTAEGTAHNVITSGGVGIELNEKMHDEDGALIDFPEEGIKDVMPGEDVEKIVSVTSTGTGDAWVRIKLSMDIQAADGSELPTELEDGTPALIINFTEGGKWTQGDDGWWYYNEVLHPGEETSTLFESVTLAPKVGNEYQECTANIYVQAQAVQVANNGDSALEATGWPED